MDFCVEEYFCEFVYVGIVDVDEVCGGDCFGDGEGEVGFDYVCFSLFFFGFD